MKKINSYLAYLSVFALLVTAGCSKEETGTLDDPANSEAATITFGAVLNDLANKAMSNNSKAHFDQVPDCSDADPAVAVIEFSYGGDDYSATVDILHDEEGYFTAYSDDLKIPVTGESTEVTLEEFMIYDGDTSEPSDAYYSDEYGNLIWIAPRRTNDNPEQFAGYVEKSLPFMFDVAAGTKPYIDVEVLCFDRRMVNEYGYVFFDIVPDTIYPLCLFANYCNEDGRHWVADYSIDLEYGTGDNIMHVLYSSDMASAMATTGTNNDGEFYADPLCLVIPGPPANLENDDVPYLTLTVYPQDWDASYGDIDNSGVVYELSWNDVYGLLNQDGETNEYLHLTLGECEGASTGDGSGGNGGNEECDNDFDGDGICDDVDADIDGDGILNVDENDGCIYNPDNNCGVTTEPMACNETLSDPDANCTRAIIPGADPIDYASNGEWLMIESGDDGQPIPLYQDLGTGYGPTIGNFTPSLSDGSISFSFVANTNYSVDGYLVEVKDASGDVDVYCTTSSLTVGSDLSYPIYIKALANVCPTN